MTLSDSLTWETDSFKQNMIPSETQFRKILEVIRKVG